MHQELEERLVVAFERMAAALNDIAENMVTPEVGNALEGLAGLTHMNDMTVHIESETEMYLTKEEEED